MGAQSAGLRSPPALLCWRGTHWGCALQGDTKNDTWIFVLAVLLSSTLIYNSKGTVDQQALENLQYPWWPWGFPLCSRWVVGFARQSSSESRLLGGHPHPCGAQELLGVPCCRQSRALVLLIQPRSYVLTLAECVKLTKSPGESGAQPPAATGLAAFFPTFVWAVRDFTLQLEADGQELSEDEYLENALKLRGGGDAELSGTAGAGCSKAAES